MEVQRHALLQREEHLVAETHRAEEQARVAQAERRAQASRLEEHEQQEVERRQRERQEHEEASRLEAASRQDDQAGGLTFDRLWMEALDLARCDHWQRLADFLRSMSHRWQSFMMQRQVQPTDRTVGFSRHHLSELSDGSLFPPVFTLTRPYCLTSP